MGIIFSSEQKVLDECESEIFSAGVSTANSFALDLEFSQFAMITTSPGER